MVPSFLIIFLSFLLIAAHHPHDKKDVININTNGPIEYCNVNPMEWDFHPLTSFDLARIKKLKQVHILARHGTRILPKPVTSVFPNSTEKWKCEWNTVDTRFYKSHKEWMSFRFHFVDNEQIVEGNCAVSSSLKEVINQHRTNADMAKAFFIGEEKYKLMTQSELNDISGELTYFNQLQENVDIPEIKIISANYERTITSATVFMSRFLNINTPEVAMKLYTHDYQSDPYTSNKDKTCKNIEVWMDDIGTSSKQYKDLINSDLYKQVVREWYDATGTNYTYDSGEGAILMYCGGLNIPLKWSTFVNSLNVSYKMREAILSNKETSITTCSLAASPMLWLFRELIHNHVEYLDQVEKYEAMGMDSEEISEEFKKAGRKSETENEYYLYAEKAKLIYHSVHDTSILFVLEALNISNGKEPMFAEMLTLEIYERTISDPYYDYNVNINTNELYSNYLFRWTRKGRPLYPFPGCDIEYKDTNSSLCSLSVLMKAMEYGKNIKIWEQECKHIVDDYFDKKTNQTNSEYLSLNLNAKTNVNNGYMEYIFVLIIGILIGVGITTFHKKYNDWFNDEKYEQLWE